MRSKMHVTRTYLDVASPLIFEIFPTASLVSSQNFSKSFFDSLADSFIASPISVTSISVDAFSRFCHCSETPPSTFSQLVDTHEDIALSDGIACQEAENASVTPVISTPAIWRDSKTKT